MHDIYLLIIRDYEKSIFYKHSFRKRFRKGVHIDTIGKLYAISRDLLPIGDKLYRCCARKIKRQLPS